MESRTIINTFKQKIYGSSFQIMEDMKLLNFAIQKTNSRSPVLKINIGENLTFIIGGPFGLSEKVIKKTDNVLALSEMTFLHEMTYILLLEQIFRGFSIVSESKYHK